MDPDDELADLPLLTAPVDDRQEPQAEGDDELADLPMLAESASGGQPDLVAQAQQETGDLGDLAMGGLDGLLLNYGDEIGSVGEGIGDSWQQMMSGDYSDQRGQAGPLHMFDDAKKTTLGKAGNVAGNIAAGTGIGLATGGLGGIGTQAAIGAGQGALAGYGEAHDPLAALLGGATGGILGAGGKAISNSLTAAKPASAMLNNAESAAMQGALPDNAIPLPELTDDMLELIPNQVPGTSNKMFAPAGRKMVDSAADDGWNGLIKQAGDLMLKNKPSMLNPQYAIGKLLQSGGPKGLRPSAETVKSMLQGVSGAVQGSVWGGDISKASGQTTARPDVPTLTWAMQSVNAAGDTGLPDDAQQRLDEALMSGDDDKVSSVYMQYSLKYPAFQRRLQSELESINEGN